MYISDRHIIYTEDFYIGQDLEFNLKLVEDYYIIAMNPKYNNSHKYKHKLNKQLAWIEKNRIIRRNKMEWINVKDKLPPKDGSHFIIANFRNKPSFQAVGWYGKVHDQYYYTGRHVFRIVHQTHWCKLPDPPKERNKCQE